jgi:cholesterol transport system auxiliary component
MMRPPALLPLAAAVSAALALSGCVTLLPKTKPVDLYRFGAISAPIAPDAPVGAVTVFRASSLFQREAGGDQLVTVTSGKVAYLAETRWVAPAAVLWDAAVLSAFDADPGRTRLISRGEAGKIDYVLRLDVRNFETRYDGGPKSPPKIVVRVRASLTRGENRSLTGERIFESQVVAAENRVTAIVPAYDRAVAEVLKDIVAWTNATAVPG